MSRKVAKIPVKWMMGGILEIIYQHPAELEELIKNVNMPKGKMIDGSFELDADMLDSYNTDEVSDDIKSTLTSMR